MVKKQQASHLLDSFFENGCDRRRRGLTSKTQLVAVRVFSVCSLPRSTVEPQLLLGRAVVQSREHDRILGKIFTKIKFNRDFGEFLFCQMEFAIDDKNFIGII